MKITVIALMAALMFSAAPLFAGGACCGGDKAAGSECHDPFAKLNLTEEQKAKVEALKAECPKDGCTEESWAKFSKGMEEILTPEQLAQWKQMCEKPKAPQS